MFLVSLSLSFLFRILNDVLGAGWDVQGKHQISMMTSSTTDNECYVQMRLERRRKNMYLLFGAWRKEQCSCIDVRMPDVCE
jgi:hypothetical protein